MRTLRHWSIAIALFSLVGAGALGCASGSKSTRSSSDRDEAAEKRTPEAPTPKQLAESPCGNPNWSQLPEEHDEDGDPETSKSEDETSSSERTRQPEEE